MKKTILTLVILLSSSFCLAGPPKGPTFVPNGALTSRPNLYGGRTYYTRNGTMNSRRNLFGGYNYYDQHGRMTLRSTPTVGGGERYQYFGR